MNDPDPNSQLPNEIIELGLEAASGAFERCKMPAQRPVDLSGCKSFLYGELGKLRILVYVRITWEDGAEYHVDMIDEKLDGGLGPMPQVLIDAAMQISAEPNVIRVHVRTNDYGTGFSYCGYNEFIEHVISNTDSWNMTLLSGKTVEWFRALVKGKLSTLHLDMSIKEDSIDYRLLIDGEVPYDGAIAIDQLVRSTARNDDYWIFTCGCGEAGCAGIWRPVIIVSEGPYTLWKAYYAKRRKIFLFDRDAYRNTIWTFVQKLVEKARENPKLELSPYGVDADYLAKLLRKSQETHASLKVEAGKLASIPHAYGKRSMPWSETTLEKITST